MNWDYFQSQLSDAAKELYSSNDVITRAWTEGKLVLITHDEVIIVDDWKSNHDPGDEDDGIEKAITRVMKNATVELKTKAWSKAR